MIFHFYFHFPVVQTIIEIVDRTVVFGRIVVQNGDDDEYEYEYDDEIQSRKENTTEFSDVVPIEGMRLMLLFLLDSRSPTVAINRRKASS